MLDEHSVARFFPDGQEPVFVSPWEAHAFAMTVKLYEKGLFSWLDWSDELAHSISLNPTAPYYVSWFNALESLALKKGIVETNELLNGVDRLKTDH